MRASFALTMASSLGVLALAPSLAVAQRVLAYDTLSAMTPAAASCGFCAGEKFGAIFYELPDGSGLAPAEFPLTLRAMRIAVARVTVTGPTACTGSDLGGTEPFDLALYAGATVPTDIAAMPASGPWPGETVLLELADVPLETSVLSAGTATFEATFNEIPILDDLGATIMVAPPNTYLRAVVGITAGGSSTGCTAPAAPPAGVPLRDDDGRIAPRRSLILANGGAGSSWLWNEDARVVGDWALRLVVTPLGAGSDGGATADAGPADAGRDAGSDAGVRMDAGAAGPDAGLGGSGGGDGGCGCRMARASGSGSGARAIVLVAGLALVGARVRARRRVATCRTR